MAIIKVELTLDEAKDLDTFVLDALGFLNNLECKPEHNFSKSEKTAFKVLQDRAPRLMEILNGIPLR